MALAFVWRTFLAAFEILAEVSAGTDGASASILVLQNEQAYERQLLGTMSIAMV